MGSFGLEHVIYIFVEDVTMTNAYPGRLNLRNLDVISYTPANQYDCAIHFFSHNTIRYMVHPVFIYDESTDNNKQHRSRRYIRYNAYVITSDQH